MHFLAVSLRKDWARVRRDPSQFFTALGIPLVLAVLMSLVFGRDPVAPHGTLLVADEDKSNASAHLLDAFRTPELARMVAIEMAPRDAARTRIDRGEASAFLLIPRGFQMAFAFNQPVRLQLYVNPSEQFIPQVVRESLAITTDAFFYLRRGVTYPPPAGRVALTTDVVHPRRRSISFAAAFLPSMLFMSLLFMANGMAGDIWRERASGTLRRLASGPVPLSAYLAARLAFIALLYVAAATLGILAAEHLAGLPVANLAAAVAWMTFAGSVFYLLFLWIATRAASQRAAAVLANLVVFPMAMLGGCFFPFEWMPAWMARIGRLTPNGWALSQFKAILEGTSAVQPLAIAALALTAAGALAFVSIERRLRSMV